MILYTPPISILINMEIRLKSGNIMERGNVSYKMGSKRPESNKLMEKRRKSSKIKRKWPKSPPTQRQTGQGLLGKSVKRRKEEESL